MSTEERERNYEQVIQKANSIRDEVLSRHDVDDAVRELSLRLARILVEQKG